MTTERAEKAAASRIGVSHQEYRAAIERGEKICGGCKQARPRTIEHFSPQPRGDGLRGKCRPCESAIEKAHYWRTHDTQRSKQLAYQRENRESLYAYNREWSTRRRAALRAEMILSYGGKCNCCGEGHPLFLQLDHINNDGHLDRKKFANNEQHWLALQKQGWPRDRYQLLCANCNFGKLMNGGICPHANAQF